MPIWYTGMLLSIVWALNRVSLCGGAHLADECVCGVCCIKFSKLNCTAYGWVARLSLTI